MAEGTEADSRSRALSQLKDAISELVQAGAAHHGAGRLKEAEQVYRQVLEVDPNQPDALNLLGVIALQVGQPAVALDLMQKAVTLRPDTVDFLNNLGSAQQAVGKVDDSIATFARALTLAPGNAVAHYNLGCSFLFQGKVKEAEARFRQAVEVMPTYQLAWLNLGNALSSQGRFEEAIDAFRKLIELAPDLAPAHNNMANALKNCGRLDEAEAALKKALALDPNYADAHDNLGIVYMRAGRLDDAFKSIRKALAMKPQSLPALNNLGLAYREKGDIANAIKTYEQALAIDGQHGEAHWNRAICWLLRGDMARGWTEYEWRWKRPDFMAIMPNFPTPAWTGESLDGKSIFVCSEQGVGDTIQFVRYAPLLEKQGARVIFGCQTELAELLKTAPGVAEIVPLGGSASKFDVHTMLLSVPRILKTTLETIPAAIPYLKADPKKAEAWAERLGDLEGLKVGLVWRGNPKHVNDHARSLAPDDLRPLLDVDGVSFASLQKGGPEVEAASLKGVRDFAAELTDFAETAAAVENLDLVIAVDTAVAHLAGALGKPVWTLLPFAPDWRWLLGRDDSPWYPTMRLFRQSKPRDWAGVIKRVRKALAAEARKR